MLRRARAGLAHNGGQTRAAVLRDCLLYTSGLCTQRTSRRLEADALDREYDPKEVRLRYIFLTCEGALVIAAIAALLLLCLA